VVAPSSPFDAGRFETGLAELAQLGFALHVPGAARKRCGFLAGTDAERARLVNDLFADPEIAVVWCARGGYGAMRCLPLVDFEGIRQNPKLLVGSSDATALLTSVVMRSGIPVCHGPMVVSLADRDEETLEGIRGLFGRAGAGAIHAKPPVVIHGGRVEGLVVGGNLTTLNHLTGTPFEPDYSGCLVFFEDIGEAPYRIDRMLTQMRMAGSLSAAAGLLLGRFSGCGRAEAVHGVFEERLGDLGIPILAGIPAGHAHPNLMMPMGVKAMLDADAGVVSYCEPLFAKRS
jgi:muramoyltetrapeptide carboxypeptidase